MDRVRLEKILAAYGADPKRWPDMERTAALNYAAEHGVDMDEAREIDTLLTLTPSVSPPSELLMARVRRSARGNLLAPLAALAACAAVGVLVGYGIGFGAPAQVSTNSVDVEQILSAAFDAPASAWSEEDS